MMYSQQQALQILALEQSTFVYWMRANPRINRLKGRGCHFTQADILALGILKAATHGLGCQISSMGSAVSVLFDIIASTSIVDLALRAIVIDSGDIRLEKLPLLYTGQSPIAVVPIRPVVEAITMTDDQLLPLERLMVRGK